MHATLRQGLALSLLIGIVACASPRASARRDKKPSKARARASTAVNTVPAKQAAGIKLERMYRGLSKPVGLEFFAGDSLARLFVVEQSGTIRALAKGEVATTPFLDISDEIAIAHSEQGLLGLAFHPDFANNRRLFVNFTDREGATRIVEYAAPEADPLVVDESTAKLLLKIEQPWRNHNGGYLEFGPDGGLYVGMGDGGAGGDPKRAGQDPNNLLGKMLRIDVATAAIKVVQSGLRNPWRFSFDRKTGDFYIGDVGQDKWEEVDVVAAKDMAGANFGWSVWEGMHCFGTKKCDATNMTRPVVEYSHQTGCSVTGGVVYHGKALPRLDGVYFYSDFCTAILRSFRWTPEGIADHWDWKEALDPRFRLSNVSAFASDELGEIYLLSTDGLIYKLVPEAP